MMGGQTRTVSVGRPRQMTEEDRRRLLIAAAADLFMSKGYHATTMDDVARSAGMSKKTVYQVFDGKSELFDALLSDWFAPCTVPVETNAVAAREILTEILLRLIEFVLSDQQLALTRLLVAETAYSEDIGAALQRQGLGEGKGVLEQFLMAQTALGVLKIENIKEAANLVFWSVAGDFMFSCLLRVRPRPEAAEVRARIDWVVERFFRQFG